MLNYSVTLNFHFLLFVVVTGCCVPSMPHNPRILKVVGGDVTVAWTQPDGDGGAEITGYIIAYCSPDDSVAKYVTAKGATTTKRNIRCKSERSYVIAVAAKNALGTGDFSHFSEHVTVPRMTGNNLVR